MLKTIIVSGGNTNIDFLNKINSKYKFNNVIACDKGLEALDKCNIKPNYIIGDFDSLNQEILDKYRNKSNVEIIGLDSEKDYTDTHMALKLAIRHKSADITIIGGVGTRLDHTIANINILKEALDKNIFCRILNENNIITLINGTTIIKKDEEYKYISLIPLTNIAKGITLKGFKYPLQNATMRIGESIGISNEQVKDNATIEIKDGILILFKTKD